MQEGISGSTGVEQRTGEQLETGRQKINWFAKSTESRTRQCSMCVMGTQLLLVIRLLGVTNKPLAGMHCRNDVMIVPLKVFSCHN
jgi:hypothetical protein